MKQTTILFVCLGNICRSPLGEGILRHLADKQGHADKLVIASAGTGGWHAGQPPDPRAIAVAGKYGINISGQRGRKIAQADFGRYDIILGMDRSNVAALKTLAPAAHLTKIRLFSDFATGRSTDIPDPYYGSQADFETVYSMLFEGCSALLGRL